MVCEYLKECAKIAEYQPQICRTKFHTTGPLYDGKKLHEKWIAQDERMFRDHTKYHRSENK